jgi:O-methyltransferase
MNQFFCKLVKKLFVAVGCSITRCQRSAGGVPLDFDSDIIALYDRVRPYTLTSPARVKVLYDSIQHIMLNNISGSIVECGVWRGGSMMAVAYTLMNFDITDRNLYLFDVFEDAMPRATDCDVTRDGICLKDTTSQIRASYWNFATESEVRENMNKTGYPDIQIHFVRGPVEQTLPNWAPDQCALIRLDTDLYESTKHELQCLYPRLAVGGILIIDDYGSHEGVKKAVDDFNKTLAQPLFLVRVDEAGRVAVKP